MSLKKFYKTIYELILQSKSLTQARNVFWKVFYDANVQCNKCAKNLHILLLNAPCHGFGDIIFCIKLANYLRSWYGSKVTIATPQVNNFIKLGEPKEHLLLLKGGGHMFQCRRYERLKFRDVDGNFIPVPQFDLIFIAPLQQDYFPNIYEVKKLIPYANRVNTKFWSEYNDSLIKGMDFNIGVGGDRLGLFITSPKIKRKRMIKEPYAFSYIAAKTHQIPDAEQCFKAFVEMISAKYSKKYSTFTLIAPSWIDGSFKNMLRSLYPRIKKYYPNIILKTKQEQKVMKEDRSRSNAPKGKTLIIRTDVLPVPNIDMLNLMKYSVQDILVTGDQSITDALSCCPTKNIFYQRVAWKYNFANNLAKYMPNKWLNSSRTSCGTIKALHFDSNYKKFLNEWDFRKRGRRMTDAVILMGKTFKKSPKLKEIADIVAAARTLNSMKKKLSEKTV